MKNGFTLIELLVVVLIIGILAAVALPQYNKAVEKSHMTEAIGLVRGLAQAEKVFFLANDRYTNKFDELDIEMPKTKGSTNTVYYTDSFQVEIHSVNTPIMHIQAKRRKTTNSGLWYIMFYFKNNTLDCMAPVNDVKGNELCQTINPDGKMCPESGWTCYPI